jgi:hypothetical protein
MIASLNPLRPYMPLIGLVLLLAYGGGMYWWGGNNARNACSAANGKASAKVEQTEDKRDANIEAIASATASAVAAELNQNRSDSNDRSERIRIVEVPGACRAIDPVIVRELRQAADSVNTALGVRVRPDPAEPGSGNP